MPDINTLRAQAESLEAAARIEINNAIAESRDLPSLIRKYEESVGSIYEELSQLPERDRQVVEIILRDINQTLQNASEIDNSIREEKENASARAQTRSSSPSEDAGRSETSPSGLLEGVNKCLDAVVKFFTGSKAPDSNPTTNRPADNREAQPAQRAPAQPTTEDSTLRRRPGRAGHSSADAPAPENREVSATPARPPIFDHTLRGEPRPPSAAAPAPQSRIRGAAGGTAAPSNLVFATKNQFDIPGVLETGGPCTYCSLQYIEDALKGERIDSHKLDEITTVGQKKYADDGQIERTSFAEARHAFSSIEPVREAHLTSADAESSDGFIYKSRNIWRTAIDLLDETVETGGAIITIAGSRFHTYAIIKKEGKYHFYDPHGEPDLKIPGNPTYEYTFATKEEFVKEMDKLRPAMSDFEGHKLTNIEGMDLNIVKLAAR